MTSGMLFALAISALVVAVLFGLVRRQRMGGKAKSGGEGPNTVVQWTEGETTRAPVQARSCPACICCARAFCPRPRTSFTCCSRRPSPARDFRPHPAGRRPPGQDRTARHERLRAFRKIANQHVGFVVCDRDMTIVAIVDSKEPEQVQNPRDQKLEIIKQRCLQAAQVKYLCVYPPTLPRYRELREQILGTGGGPGLESSSASAGAAGLMTSSDRPRRQAAAEETNRRRGSRAMFRTGSASRRQHVERQYLVRNR